MLIRTLILIFFFHNEATAYKAAVVEYHPVLARNASETISRNLQQYKCFVRKAKKASADIIVFPEYGLTTLTNKVEDFSVEINPNTSLIQDLSLLAQQEKIYLVVNLLEKINSSNTKFYNTNLVFDRNGKLILKYQKINLFGEPNLTAGASNQTNIFETDFGVTFGTMTCFDILYHNPSRTILENQIQDIVYPTSWFSTMAFYSSLSIQHGYSVSTKTNLLASNIADPGNTHSGSGIYLKTGNANIYINDVPESKLLVQEVPKTGNLPFRYRSNMNNYQTLRDFVASDYNFTTIDLNKNKQSVDICHKNFCCAFDVSVFRSPGRDIYKVMAYDGTVPFDVGTAHIKVCSLLICENNLNESCGRRVAPSTAFSKLSVLAKVESSKTTFCNPLSLDFHYEPLLNIDFSTAKDQNLSLVQFRTSNKSTNLLVFGIYCKTD